MWTRPIKTTGQEPHTEGVVIDAVRRDRQTYSGGVDYTLSEKSTVSLAYLYDQEDYKGMPTSNNSSNAASLGYEYDLKAFLPSARGRLNFGFNTYQFPDSDTDNYTPPSASAGHSAKPGILRRMGGRYTSADFDVTTFVPIQEPPFFSQLTVRQSNTGYGWGKCGPFRTRGDSERQPAIQPQRGSFIEPQRSFRDYLRSTSTTAAFTEKLSSAVSVDTS
jgi:hypothetical protein